MYVAFVDVAADGQTYMDLFPVQRAGAFYAVFGPDHPAIVQFLGANGRFDPLFDLQGGYATFQFDDLISDEYYELANIVSIKKLKGKA